MATHAPFSGTELLDAPPAKVFAFVTDLDALSKIVPGLVSATRTGPDSVLCQVKPGFSFIRTTLKMTFTLVEKRADEHVMIRVDATGIGTAFSVETKMDLVPSGTGTQMAWTATIIKMSGLVSAVGTTIIRAAGDQVIKDGFAALRKAMAN
ncbi:MAG: hypothetical protein FJ254_09335 [Phycisphaerae bacterium]|nr:hypothetical protein [Phycisphaerae bacterium]